LFLNNGGKVERKSNLKPSLIDIPVLLIFMARPDQFGKVFEQVRIARPSRLFLYQDGPRKGRQDDIENIARCREIAKNVDWNCQVFKMYQKKNIGCDPSVYLAQKWMFEHVDRGIILEDDIVVSQSFFPFCQEMLERYAEDNRIGYICGMNHLEIYNNDPSNSYFFTSLDSIWGWATWKRTIDQWDEKLDFLNDINALSLLEKNIGQIYFKHKLQTWKQHKTSGKAYFESILNSSLFLNSQLSIIPSKNLISNIGLTADATHTSTPRNQLPKRLQQLFNMKRHELDFPLRRPKYIMNDIFYKDKVSNILGKNVSWLTSKKRSIKNKIRKIFIALTSKKITK